MSAGSRRRLSIALLPLAWAAACGGTVLEHSQGEAHGGAGGDSAVFVGHSGGSGAGSGATLASGNAPGSAGYASGSAGYASGSAGYASGSAGYASGSAGYASGSGGYTIGGGGAPPFGGVTTDSGTDPGCAAIAQKGDVVVPDILILLDRSLSMSCPVAGGGDRWTAVKAALSAFLMQSGPGGQSVGIAYFEPGSSGDAGLSCNPEDYQTPDVELAPLPKNTKLILDSLERHSPGGETPTPPALIGAINHAVDWRGTHSSAAVVLVTDGAPDACGSLLDVESAAAAGSKLGVETFVIGLLDSGTCNLDTNPTNQKDIDAIAQAGSSLGAFGIDLTNGVDAQLLNALSQVTLSTPPACRYRLPSAPPPGEQLDLGKLNVGYTTVSSPERMILSAVANPSACDPTEGGWYFDNPNAPQEIDLCPASCDTITKRRGDVNIYIGCATKRP